MADTIAKITIQNIKKMLKESILSDELKTAYLEVLADMNEEEKAELIRIIEEGNTAKAGYEEERLGHLARINKALKKHLADSQHEEEKYVREQFEAFEGKEEEEEMKDVEQEINQL
jgi:hypothetical protein